MQCEKTYLAYGIASIMASGGMRRISIRQRWRRETSLKVALS
jgi:hypothetical protein